jgi:hypothetical protein
MQGGHCVTAYKPDIQNRLFWGPNSWGPKWGGKMPGGSKIDERGYIGVPFGFFLSGEADDAWAIKLEDAPA